MRQHFGIVSLGLVATLSIACSKPTTPEPVTPEPEPVAAEPAAPPSEKPGDDPKQSSINISDEIKEACGLSDTEAHFGYNSANVSDKDRDVMKKLAECFTVGKLKGRTMRLVGHADPRGEPEYNMVLGG